MHAKFHLLLLLLLALCLIAGAASSRSIPFHHRLYKPGGIPTNGFNYSKVCDPARFAAMGLDMSGFTYCDASLSYEARVKDLIGLMFLGEKVKQLGDRAQGVSRIGLPSYNWWSEALHGVAETGHATYFGDVVPGATVFPNVILSAASFNKSLWRTLGQVVSTEARAMYNMRHSGLTYWSPNINVARDPRWGRILETPGEDPYLTGVYSVEYVRGLQDVEMSAAPKDPKSRPLKVSACCKHFTAYDLDSWFDNLITRFHFDSRVTEQDMVETFNRPFEACVREGDASSIMCSFNRINGVPVCADARLMSQTFRNEWDLHGYIVSDCDSIKVIHKDQKWLNVTEVDAVAQVMHAGLDLSCGIGEPNYYTDHAEDAVKQGRVREMDIDNALKNLYMVLMRLGFFDGNPLYDSLGTKDICTKENIELAADAARQSIVLLKNSNTTLPLDPKKHKKLALVGPHADAKNAMRGNYAGAPCRYVSPVDAFKGDVQVNNISGCNDVHCHKPNIPPAVQAAMDADATIIFVGLDLSIEAEMRDRDSLTLPGHQAELVNKVVNAAKGPVVLVIMSGGIVDVSFAEKNPKVGAIVWAGYPGQEGGQAIADVIFGRHNPGGRLPLTWYNADYVDALPMTSMQLRPVKELGYPGRTYKFFNGPVQYPFGHGLSYTTFAYTVTKPCPDAITVRLTSHQQCKPVTYKPRVTAPSCPSVHVIDSNCRATIDFEIEVANIGKVDGSEAVLVYSKPPADIDDAPIKQLVAFERVTVPAGKSEKVMFSLNVCKALGLVEKTAYVVVPAGEHIIEIGNGDKALSFPLQIRFH